MLKEWSRKWENPVTMAKRADFFLRKTAPARKARIQADWQVAQSYAGQIKENLKNTSETLGDKLDKYLTPQPQTNLMVFPPPIEQPPEIPHIEEKALPAQEPETTMIVDETKPRRSNRWLPAVVAAAVSVVSLAGLVGYEIGQNKLDTKNQTVALVPNQTNQSFSLHGETPKSTNLPSAFSSTAPQPTVVAIPDNWQINSFPIPDPIYGNFSSVIGKAEALVMEDVGATGTDKKFDPQNPADQTDFENYKKNHSAEYTSKLSSMITSIIQETRKVYPDEPNLFIYRKNPNTGIMDILVEHNHELIVPLTSATQIASNTK